MNLELSILSLAVSFITLGLLIPVYGKVFFSSHQVEFLPMDEWIEKRQKLGLPEIKKPKEEVKINGMQSPEGIQSLEGYVPPKESFDELRMFDPRKWSAIKKRPSGGESD